MSLNTFFKPNPSSTGSMLSIRAGKSKNGADMIMFFQIIKQDSWSQKTRTGSFSKSMKDPSKKTSVMFNMTEVAGLVNTLKRRNEQFSVFHKTAAGSSQISLSFRAEEQNGEKKSPAGFFLSIKKGEQVTRFSLTVSEGEQLRSLLESALAVECTRLIIEDMKRDNGANSEEPSRAEQEDNGQDEDSDF